MLPDPTSVKMTKDWMKYYEKNNNKEGLVGYFLQKIILGQKDPSIQLSGFQKFLN